MSTSGIDRPLKALHLEDAGSLEPERAEVATNTTGAEKVAADAKPALHTAKTQDEIPLSTLAAESGASVVAAASAAPPAVEEIDAPLADAVIAPAATEESQPINAATAPVQQTTGAFKGEPAPTLLAVTPTPQRADLAPTQSGQGVWQLKEITWPDPRVGGERRTAKILVQDENGPCSLLALANILILRGSIHVTPRTRQVVEYDYLSALIADFLISRPSGDSSLSLESALSILPSMTQGLNIDVSFKDIWSFKGTGNAGELAIFQRCGVPLVHGWVADKDGPEYAAVTQAETYDGAQMAIVAGMELQDKADKNADELTVVKNAHAIDNFVNSTATQITYAGLFSLTSSLEQGSIVAFFRNSHLGVLYRRPPSTPSETREPNDASDALLYQLVTDSSFANEPEVAWESLVDLDGSASTFVNGDFQRSAPGGGEYAGLSASHAARVNARRDRGELGAGVGLGDGDAALARMLQAEEDQESAQRISDRGDARSRRTSNTHAATESGRRGSPAAIPSPSTPPVNSSSTSKKLKQTTEEKKKCLIM